MFKNNIEFNIALEAHYNNVFASAYSFFEHRKNDIDLSRMIDSK